MSDQTTAREMVSNRLKTVAEAMGVCLVNAGVLFHRHDQTSGAEAWHTFHIDTPPQTLLDVRVTVLDDSMEVSANGAAFYVDLAPWEGNVAGWVSECVSTVESLLRHPLRIRVRRTVFGGARGAIWVVVDSNGAWSGDLTACRGKGSEHTYPWPLFVRRLGPVGAPAAR